MRGAALGLVAGAALLHRQAVLPSWFVLAAVLAAAIALICLFRAAENAWARSVAMVAAGALVGFAWAGIYAQYRMQDELPEQWEGRDITLVGTVASLPYRFERGERFDFAVERVIGGPEGPEGPEGPGAVPRRLALSWYAGFRKGELLPAAPVEPGERWQLTVRLRRPHGNANPDGFDYEVWLLERGLRATGYVRPDQRSALKNARLNEFVFSFGNAVERSRGWLRERILAALPGKQYAGVIVALVIGDQRAIGQSDWLIFNRTGIGHLISISGLHITMIAGLFAAAMHALWRRSFFTRRALPLLLPAQKAAALAGVLAALVYVLLAGFGVPAQRTLYMLGVVAAALWLGRIANVSQVLCAALATVVLLDPWAVLWPGFWLSFGAVAIILYASVGRGTTQVRGPQTLRQRCWQLLRTGAYTQYVVTVGLVPLTMLLFGQISLVSPIANALAIPVISFAVTPLALGGALLPAPLCGWTLAIAHATVEGLAHLLGWLSAAPLAVWGAPLPAPWIFTAALVGTLWLLAPAGWPLRRLGIAWLLPLAVAAPARPGSGELWVTAFDIGQGTAVLIETHGRRLLYDTGPAYSEDGDGGNRVILPYLKVRGIHSLDGIVVSHSDTDHAGGALSILEEIDVGWVSSSLPAEHAIVRRAPAHQRCEQGESWTWDEVRFELLHPSAPSYDDKKLKPNHRSCTLKVTLGDYSVLLPGDIESGQEAELVAQDADKLRSTILFAPHHGSGTSSTAAFLDAVQPAIAVFQVGYRNRYRHPKAEVYERYGERGVRRLRTDQSGAIRFRIGTGLEVGEYRSEHARYWYGSTGSPPTAGAEPDAKAAIGDE
jgi:competence protein ComEC